FRQPRTVTRSERRLQSSPHALYPYPLPRCTSCKALGVTQGFPDELRVTFCGQSCQRLERQSAPGRAQHREPRRAVAQMMQGTGERDEVAHDRQLLQPDQIDPDGIDLSRLEGAHDRGGMIPRGDEHSDARLRGALADCRDVSCDAGRLEIALVAWKQAK